MKTLAEYEEALSNAVYEASRFIEEAEHAGLAFGNGHHARQKLAAEAVRELRRRWKDEDEVREQGNRNSSETFNGEKEIVEK